MKSSALIGRSCQGRQVASEVTKCRNRRGHPKASQPTPSHPLSREAIGDDCLPAVHLSNFTRNPNIRDMNVSAQRCSANRRRQALIAVQLAEQSALNDILTSRIIVQRRWHRKSDMLDKRLNNTEPSPARRVLRLFGLDNGRGKESPTARSHQTKEPEERKHQFATWYIFAAFLGVMLIQNLWIQYAQVETIPYPIRAVAQ